MSATRRRFSPERLREARGDRRLEEIAVAVGKGIATIRRWEEGGSEPDASDLLAIAELADKALDFFFVSIDDAVVTTGKDGQR